MDNDEVQTTVVLNPIEWILKRDLMVLFANVNICNMLEN